MGEYAHYGSADAPVAVPIPPAADGPGGMLDEVAFDTLRIWYECKFVSPKTPKALELGAAARKEVE